MADNFRIRNSIKNFLEKMKAMDDAIPEELANDALEMTEEVSDALNVEEEVKDEEANVLEVTKDEEIENKVEDAITKVLRKHGLIKDECISELDELEEKLTEKSEDECKSDAEDEDMGEDEVTVKAESMNDSMLKFIRKVKPIIANMKDASDRRKMSRAIAEFANIKKTADYSAIRSSVSQNIKTNLNNKMADADYDFGMELAKKYNPHYKKED